MDDLKQYTYMEPVLQYVSGNYISLDKYEVQRNNAILNKVVTKITGALQRKDKLFNRLYTKLIFHGGSFYDGLKIGSPDEYDLHLPLVIPKELQPELVISNVPGYVNVKINDYNDRLVTKKYSEFESFVDEKGYLIHSEIRGWLHSIIVLTLNEMENQVSYGTKTIEISLTTQGPAFTLRLSCSSLNECFKFDIDLVPCFIMDEQYWPVGGYRANPFQNNKKLNTFFIIPKSPKTIDNYGERYWRLSFQPQERKIMHDKNFFKPSIKFLKALRDQDKEKLKFLKSYFIKNVFIWELEELHYEQMWTTSLSYCFLYMLEKLQKYMENANIPYYWNKKDNLILPNIEEHCENIGRYLQKIIDDIKTSKNPFTVAKYLVNEKEFKEVKAAVEIPKNSIIKYKLKF